MSKKLFSTVILSLLLILSPFTTDKVSANSENDDQQYIDRMALYKKVETITHIPWYYLAAIDQYERNIRFVRRDLPKPTGRISIYFSPVEWSGPVNPDEEDTNPFTISLFGGMGLDGNGDGKADRQDDEDILYTFAHYVSSHGVSKNDIKIALWEHYKRDKTVSLIMGHAKLFKTLGRIKLDDHRFPVPLNWNYSYRSTWGDTRGWGGLRIHEGTDIFAGYGVPVRATSYGIIEIKGWNRYGGWRIGIRDINNTYHYFAHLRGFNNDLKVGQVVEPGTIIGYVGSSGYGPPGTQGKFPPHLHYGMYKDNGYSEWSFNPYPHLRLWERQERKR